MGSVLKNLPESVKELVSRKLLRRIIGSQMVGSLDHVVLLNGLVDSMHEIFVKLFGSGESIEELVESGRVVRCQIELASIENHVVKVFLLVRRHRILARRTAHRVQLHAAHHHCVDYWRREPVGRLHVYLAC